jgi:hypothetical protein
MAVSETWVFMGRQHENDVYETGCEDVVRIHLAQYNVKCRAVVNTVTSFHVPQMTGIFLTSSATIKFSRILLPEAKEVVSS